MAHVRDRPSLRESNELVTPSGRRYRWASDEPDPANRPRDERWSDIVPGGFETADAVLPRKPGVDYSDLERLTRWTRYDASGGVIWQGRLERAPRVSGDQIAISPSAVGYQAHLEDDKSAAVVFIDRDLTRWTGANSQRRINILGAGTDVTDATPTVGTDGLPSLLLEIVGAWARQVNCEAYYRMPAGTDAGTIAFDFQASALVNTADANWVGATFSSDPTELGFTSLTSDWLSASSGSTSATASGFTAGFMVRIVYGTGPAGTDNGHYQVHLRNLRVTGAHGLTVRGSTQPDTGYYDADMVQYVLDQWCPLITYTTETVTSDPFVIPHMVFTEPTTPGEMIRQIIRFGLRDWAVWEGPTFWLHDRGAHGRKWRARVGPAQLEETGPQVDRLWNAVVVSYQDADGTTRTVGPTGSGADTETADLLDADPENPANKTGIRRWATLAMGTSTSAGAIQVGRRFLEETKRLDNSGRARIVGHVQDDRGVWHPYSHVRAGDQIAFIDASDTSYRRIVKTDKSRSDRTCSMDLDAPPEGLQALLERLGVVLVSLGV